MRIALFCLALVSTPALAMLAQLVDSRTGTSVTGQAVWVCVYEANGQRFSRTIPLSAGPCPPTVDVY